MQPYKTSNDFLVRVIGSLLFSHFIEVLGREESFFELLFKRFYYKDVLSGFLIALITWEYTFRITRWLDQKYDWMTRSIQRIALQLLLGVFVGSLLIFFLTYLQFKFVLNNPLDYFFNDWLVTYYPVCVLLVALVNAYYFTRYLFSQWRQAQLQLTNRIENEKQVKSESNEQPATRDVIIVTQGAKNLPVAIKDIALIYIWEQYTYIKLFSGESFITANSLDEIFAWLDKDKFFRANRQVIINFRSCRSYTAIENGKIEVHAEPSHKEAIIVSQKKAREFKEWLTRPVNG